MTSTAPRCSTGVLQLSESPGGNAAGSSYLVFELKNSGPSTCTLGGYPKVTLFGPSAGSGAGAGPRLSVGAENGGSARPGVSIAPKHSAEFLVVFSLVPVNGAGCSTVASVEVQPPGSTESVSGPVSFSPCGPSVTVYPFAEPGSESP